MIADAGAGAGAGAGADASAGAGVVVAYLLLHTHTYTYHVNTRKLGAREIAGGGGCFVFVCEGGGRQARAYTIEIRPLHISGAMLS